MRIAIRFETVRATALRPAALLLGVTLTASAWAQVRDQAPVAPASTLPADEVLELSPFVVNSAEDRGYQAQSSLGGSRIKTNLKDIAAPTTAFTQQFLEDVAINNTDDLARFMLSTEYDFGEDTGGQNRLNGGIRPLRMRGLNGGTVSVNFFKSNFRLDTFSTERIDQSRGPNSVLFGVGAPGGIINVTTKRARLDRRTGYITIQGSSEEGLREEVDYNQPLIANKLGIRVAAVQDKRNSWRNYEFNDSERIFGTMKWRITSKTELNVEAEKSEMLKQTKRTYTAIDAYTTWRDAGSQLSATPNASLGIARVAGNNVPWLVYDTASGTLTNWANKTNTAIRSAGGDEIALYDFSVLPKETAIYGPGFDQSTDYTRLSAYLTHAFTPNLNFELAAMRTDSINDIFDPQTIAAQALRADTNATLPSGAPNPNAGRAYLESIPQTNTNARREDAVRLIGSYTRDLGRWGKHNLAGVYEYNYGEVNQTLLREGIINAAGAFNTLSPYNNNNRIWRRTYVNLNGPSKNVVMANPRLGPTNGLVETLSGRTVTTAWIPFNPNTQFNSSEGNTLIGMLQSSFWKDRIKTVIGASQDRRDDYLSTQTVDVIPGFTQAGTNGIIRPVRSTTPDKIKANSLSFSAVYHANSWLSLTYSQAENSALPNVTGRLNIAPNSYIRPPVPRGKSQDYGFKLDLLDHRVFVTAVYFETSAERDFEFFDLNPAINPIWNGLNSAGITSYNGVAIPLASNALGSTFDSSTDGFEIELTANLTPNWRVFANYSNQKSVRKNIGAEERAYVEYWRPAWVANGAVAVANGTVASQIAVVDQAILNTYILAENERPLGQIQHKFNLRTNYDFSTGVLKGFSVGGGTRYLGKPVIGFTSTGTVGNVDQTVFLGSDQLFIDFNAAYRRKLKVFGRSILWTAQLNVNNVTDNDAFIRLRQADDGTLLNYRFNPPREWIVSSKFSF